MSNIKSKEKDVRATFDDDGWKDMMMAEIEQIKRDGEKRRQLCAELLERTLDYVELSTMSPPQFIYWLVKKKLRRK